MESVATKVCSKCGTPGPLDAFYTARSRPDGLTSQCKKCFAEYRAANKARLAEWQRVYRRDSAEVTRETDRRTRVKNAEKRRKRARDWYARNSEYAKASSLAWQRTNRERRRVVARMATQRRRARQAGLPVYEIAPRDLARIMSAQCSVTGCPNVDIELDHVIPVARGGSHGIGNLQPLCSTHNISKGKKLWIEFVVYLRTRPA